MAEAGLDHQGRAGPVCPVPPAAGEVAYPTGVTQRAVPSRRRCAVLGSPVAHSLSPALHAAAYDHLGLEWEYGRHEVTEDGLAGFLEGLDASWRGLSLTMPLKQAALGLAHEASAVARQAVAANTILLEPDGRRVADNTDVPGMANALRETGATRVPVATVLGGGSTARSAVVSLAGLAGRVEVFVRNPARAGQLARAAAMSGVRAEVLAWEGRTAGLSAPLVVVTTPRGACDDLAGSVPSAPGTLLDVVYDPWPTPLAAQWESAGGTVVSGLDLLVHQAALQVLLMTGRPVPLAVLRRALTPREASCS